MTADERAVALIAQWWEQGPVADTDSPAAIIDDVRSLFAHLEANGYEIVAKETQP